MSERYEGDEAVDEREAARGRMLPGIVEEGEKGTIKRNPKTPDRAEERLWGSEAMEARTGVTPEQTAEESDYDTPQPAPTGHDEAEATGHTAPGPAPRPADDINELDETTDQG